MAKVEITKELLEKYKRHPRILEIRLILLFDMFEKEFGFIGTKQLFSGLCKGMRRNEDVLDMIINRRFDIKRKSKTNRYKWRQEVLFMGLCYGETLYKIAKDYLSIDVSNMYKNNAYCNPDTFLTDEWLRNLDDEVFIAGGHMYQDEVNSFLDTIEGMTNVLMRWKPKGGTDYVLASKTQI